MTEDPVAAIEEIERGVAEIESNRRQEARRAGTMPRPPSTETPAAQVKYIKGLGKVIQEQWRNENFFWLKSSNLYKDSNIAESIRRYQKDKISSEGRRATWQDLRQVARRAVEIAAGKATRALSKLKLQERNEQIAGTWDPDNHNAHRQTRTAVEKN